MRAGIPPFRLPREVLDRQIRDILDLGVELKLNAPIGPDLTIDGLLEGGYMAVFAAVGAQKSSHLGIEGEELEGVGQGIEFIRRVNLGEPVRIGGRVAVMGYYPWSQVHSLAKSSQMKALSQWLSGGTVPVLVDSFTKVTVWCRDGAAGRKATVVLNGSLDRAEKLDLRIRSGHRTFAHISSDGTETALPAEAAEDGYARLRMPALAPWTIHLLLEA